MKTHSPTCARLVAAPNGIDGHVQDCTCGFVVERGPRLSGSPELDGAIAMAGTQNLTDRAIRNHLNAFLEANCGLSGLPFWRKWVNS